MFPINYLGAQLLSDVWLFVTPYAIAHQTTLSIGFFRQEYWSGLPFSTLVTWCEYSNSLEKTLMLGKTEGKRGKGRQRMRWFDGIINSMLVSLSKLQEIVKEREAWHAAVHGGTKSWTRLRNWACIHVAGIECVSGRPGGGEFTESWVRARGRRTRREDQVDKGLTVYSPKYIIICYSVLSQ